MKDELNLPHELLEKAKAAHSAAALSDESLDSIVGGNDTVVIRAEGLPCKYCQAATVDVTVAPNYSTYKCATCNETWE